MKTSGFTLIELLIVIVILVILAGGILPYALEYIEESRISRAKADLEELKTALMTYEIKRDELYLDTTGTTLYKLAMLTKLNHDPWGRAYVIRPEAGTLLSLGSDGVPGSDDIILYYQPKLAVTAAYWVDSNQNSSVDLGDKVLIRFAKPLKAGISGDAGAKIPGKTDPTGGVIFGDNRKGYYLTWGAAPDFVVGQDSVLIDAATGFVDGVDVKCIPDTIKIQAR